MKIKEVYLNGKRIITDWKKVSIVSPENFRTKIQIYNQQKLKKEF